MFQTVEKENSRNKNKKTSKNKHYCAEREIVRSVNNKKQDNKQADQKNTK
jgi:hypothetical protein